MTDPVARAADAPSVPDGPEVETRPGGSTAPSVAGADGVGTPSVPGPPILPDQPGAAALREQFRALVLAGVGGWSGMVITAIPTVVFVVVNAVGSLRAAVAAAVGSAVLLSVYRLARRQPVQQAFTGLLGVIVAAAIAARTGQARGYFLLGIGASLLYGTICLVSLVARRPVVGLVWEYLDPTPEDGTGSLWYHRRELLVAYTWATAAVTAVFASRGVVQLALFARRDTGLLAVARIAMGYPLTALALAFAFWIVRRARTRSAPLPGEDSA
jgi:Protein of unknown function (DUF3159)